MRVLERLGLRPEDEPRLWAGGLFQLAFIVGVVLLKAASNALFLHRSAAEKLPLLYLGTAALAFLASTLGARVARGTSRLVALCAPATVALFAAVHYDVPGAPAALYLFGETFATTVSIRFWGELGDLVDARAGRRLYGAVGGFAMAGSIVGGLAAQGLSKVVGAAGLVPIAALCMIATAFFGARLDADHRAAQLPLKVKNPARVSYVARDPFPRTLAFLAVALAVLTALADYSFRLRAHALLGEDGLAALFGEVQLVLGVLGALFQFLLAGPLLQRLGIFAYLALCPLAAAACAAFALFSGALGPAYALKVAEALGSYSVSQAGLQLLYGPMPDEARTQARAFIDALAKKAGLALGGAMLLGLAWVAKPQLVANALVLAAVAAILALLFVVRGLYVKAVEARLAVRAAEPLTLDEADGGALAAAIAQGSEEQVLAAVALGRRAPGFELAAHCEAMLDHPAERVRAMGARYAARAGRVDLVPRLHMMVEGDGRRAREAALRALSQLAPESVPRVFAPLLDSPDPAQRAAAIDALLNGEDEVAKRRAEVALHAWLAAERLPLRERRLVVKLLGRLRDRPESAALARFLDDPDAGVRRLAAAAAGRARRGELVEPLFAALARRATRRAARSALARWGDDLVPEIARRLNDRALPVELRNQLPRLLRYIGTESAAQELLFSNITDDARLRYRIAVALWRMREENPALRLDARRLHEAAHRRLDAYRHYLPSHDALAEHPGPPEVKLLARAVADRLDQNLEIAFRLLGLISDPNRAMAAYHRFVGGSGHDRAFAAELVELTADQDLKADYLAALDGWHRGPRHRAPHRRDDAVRELCASADETLALCAGAAFHALGLHAAPGSAVRVRAEDASASPRPAAGPSPATPMPRHLLERVLFLETVELFASAGVDDLVAVAGICKERLVQAGETIFAEGDAGATLYTVVEGEVACVKSGVEILRVKEREGFGESSFLDEGPRAFGAVAVTGARLLAIDRADFMDLVADRPEVLKGLFSVLTRHLRSLMEAAVARGKKAAS